MSRLIALCLSTATALLLLANFAAAVESKPQRATVADGTSVDARFIGTDEHGNLQFSESGRVRSIEPGNLITWGAFAEPAGGAEIVVPGGWLRATSLRVEEDRLFARSALLGQINLPLEAVAGLVLRPSPQRAQHDARRDSIAQAKGRLDYLLLDNGDDLSGTLISLNERQVVFETAANKLNFDLQRVAGVMFNPSLVGRIQGTGQKLLVGLSDGSRLTASKLTTADSMVRLELAAGGELAVPIETIIALQTLGGRAIYLSDLQPASYRHLPYLELAWPFRTDRSVLGAQLRGTGQTFAKGLGMHSPSRITFDVEPGFRRFEAEVAVDEEAGNSGSVVFRIFTEDSAGQLQERFKSETLRGGQPPIPISIDLGGVKRISLLVDFADRGDEMDHADWLNARFIR